MKQFKPSCFLFLHSLRILVFIWFCLYSVLVLLLSPSFHKYLLIPFIPHWSIMVLFFWLSLTERHLLFCSFYVLSLWHILELVSPLFYFVCSQVFVQANIFEISEEYENLAHNTYKELIFFTHLQLFTLTGAVPGG